MLLLLLLVGVSAYAIGSLSSGLKTSIAMSEATDAYLDAAVARLDEGDADRVAEDVRRLADDVMWTKESVGFVDAMNTATLRLEQGAGRVLDE